MTSIAFAGRRDFVLEAWRAPGTGAVSIVLARRASAPPGTIRSPLRPEQLEEIDLDAHELVTIDGANTAKLSAPIFARRALAVLGHRSPSPRRREHVEIVPRPRRGAA